MSAADKIARYVENLSAAADDIELYAEPGGTTVIDTIDPITGLTRINRETLDQVRARYPLAERMTWAAWTEAASARQRTPITWSETTRARYWEMLEVLPPAMQAGGAFLVGEPWDHDVKTGAPRFQAFRQIGADDDPATRYEVASRPITARELRAILNQGAATP